MKHTPENKSKYQKISYWVRNIRGSMLRSTANNMIESYVRALWVSILRGSTRS